jgi:3-isopropylmalate/(R)-2-methylmalate dehydratase large subunit
MKVPDTLFEKLWQLHTIEELEGGTYLLHIDRCYLHDLSGPSALGMLNKRNLSPHNPELAIGTLDHTLCSMPGRTIDDSFASKTFVPMFREFCSQNQIRLFDLNHPLQGIVHVMGPETGLTLPGMTVVCGDSHTCTHGALGALAWGVGSTDLYHALATQTLLIKKPKTLRINIEGIPAPEAGPMDIILRIIAELGTNFGVGYAIEYAGSAISAMDMEGRMTICNLTVEMGSDFGLISPDQKTIDYIKNKRFAPQGEMLDQLISHSLDLATDKQANFDKELTITIDDLKPQISWGINPSHVVDIDGIIPELQSDQSDSQKKALEYMDFQIGQQLIGTPIDRVFIGSCANGRLSNLEKVAEIVKGKRVAEGVVAWVVPGSQAVKSAVEKLGLDLVFVDAGLMWGEPGCSLCAGSSGEQVGPGKRCVSTTNRNFVGRQGPMARTHLASPSTAAWSAVNGVISNHQPIS